jgi:hypothetical protein
LAITLNRQGVFRDRWIAGGDEEFDLKSDSRVPVLQKSQAGKILTLEGNLVPGKDLKAPVPLEVKEVRGDQ